MSGMDEDVVAFRVLSCSDGTFRVEAYYDESEWPMTEEDGRWYMYPGVVSRIWLANEIASVLNDAVGLSPERCDALQRGIWNKA